jgi:hypothetical protein
VRIVAQDLPRLLGDIVAGEMIAHVSLGDPNFVGPRDPSQRRPFTEDDARAVVKVLQDVLDASTDSRLSQLELVPVASARDPQAARNFSPVFFGSLNDDGTAKDPHALVRIELKGHTEWENAPDNYAIVASAVKELNKLQGRPIDDLGRVQLVLPNFIMTGGSHHGSSGSGGGPGAPPIPMRASDVDNLGPRSYSGGWNGIEWPFHVGFIGNSGGGLEEAVAATNRGAGVIVLVLDTAPQLDAIQNAPFDNPLLISLRRALTKVSEDLGDLPVSPVFPSGGGEPYRMTDHGLFVAGLIHDIAPAAEIQLWRVLNAWGGGDLNTLFHAMSEALELARGTTKEVVINLSLVINTPEDVKRLTDAWGSQGFDFDQPFLDLVELVIGAHLNTDCVAVAAAGNGSGDPNLPARLPRYPARLNKLIGVAAMTHRGGPAEYSDRGEDPGSTPNAVATFGGNAAYPGGKPQIPEETDQAGGVITFRDAPIGLMISPHVPEETSQDNTTGWAYWSGTSFATPIVSGLVACLLSGWPSEARPGTANIINTIRTKAVENGPQANLGVNGIPARQLKLK